MERQRETAKERQSHRSYASPHPSWYEQENRDSPRGLRAELYTHSSWRQRLSVASWSWGEQVGVGEQYVSWKTALVLCNYVTYFILRYIYNKGRLVKSKSSQVKDLSVSSGLGASHLTSRNLHFLIYEMVLFRVKTKRKHAWRTCENCLDGKKCHTSTPWREKDQGRQCSLSQKEITGKACQWQDN